MLFLTFIFCTVSPILSAQTLGVEWLQHIGNSNRDIINDMAVDKQGAIYSIGSFSDIFQVDGKSGMAANGVKDAFISKTSKDGKLIWAKQIGSKGQDFACRLAVSPNGCLYVIGGFDKTADAGKKKAVNPDKGLYIAQFSGSGDVKWVKYFTSNEFNHYTGITTGPDNSVYVMGCFYDSLALDKKVWKADSVGQIFMAQFSNEGELKAFKQFKGKGEKYPSVLQTSGDGLWMGGHYTQTLEADSIKLALGSKNKKGLFAIMLKNDLSVEGGWTISEGSKLSLSAIVADSTGTVFLGGDFSDSMDTQGKTLKALGEQDVFVIAIDTAGHTLWSQRAGGLRTSYLADMAQAHRSELLLAFASNSSARYEHLAPIEHKGFDDIQLAALDTTGRFLWSAAYGGINEDFPTKIAVDKDDKIILAASFKEKIAIGQKNLVSIGSKDILIAKLVDCSKQKPHLLGDTLLCHGNKGELYAKDPSYLSYEWENGASMSQHFSISKAGIYHFKALDKYGCKLSDSIRVRSVPLPSFTIGKDTTIFETQSLDLKPNKDLKVYQWQDFSNFKNLTFSGSIGEGQHLVWLLGTDANGCSNSDSIKITVKPVHFSNSQQLSIAHISIYPNPAHERVSYSIDASFQNIIVRVVDTYGHVYLEKSFGNYLEGTREYMNVSMLKEGMYYIKVYSGSVVRSEKFYVK